jgi:anaerobic ribonucleoside-triphosphate reductase activating protein
MEHDAGGDAGTGKVRIFGTADDSIVDGSGIRFAIFTQGCSQGCPGCHNPESHSYTGGSEISADELWSRAKANPLISGITFSGGEPFDQAAPLVGIAGQAHEAGKNVWAYTGYMFEDILDGSAGEKMGNPHFDADAARELLKSCDVIVDGPFIQSKKSYDLLFRGSANQRLIDVPKSLDAGCVVEWKQ